MEKGKRLVESSCWERLTEEKLGLVLMGGAMLSKSLIQFSVDGQGCVPSLLFDLRANYGGGNEDNGDLLQKVPCTHPAFSAPDPCLCQRLLDLRFTEHGPAHQNKTQFPLQSVSPIRKLP